MSSERLYVFETTLTVYIDRLWTGEISPSISGGYSVAPFLVFGRTDYIIRLATGNLLYIEKICQTKLAM